TVGTKCEKAPRKTRRRRHTFAAVFMAAADDDFDCDQLASLAALRFYYCRCARRGFCPAYFLAAGYRIPPCLCIPLGSHSNRSIRRTVTYRWDYAWQLPTWRLRAHAYLGGRTLERCLGRPRYCGCHLGFNLCTPIRRKSWQIR